MSTLIYCIFEHPPPSGLEAIKGIGGEPLSLVEANGLIAAVSPIVPPDLTPNLERLRQYQTIIEGFHNDCTVIPMRYGCLVAEESEVIRILKIHGEEYRRLLRELEGCDEMGIRVLRSASAPDEPPRQTGSGPGGSLEHQANQIKFTIQNKPSDHPGQAYLAVRKAHYHDEETINRETMALIEDYRKVFAGLFVKLKKEGPSRGRTRTAVHKTLLFSLYFLVPKKSVKAFRRVFQGLPDKEGQKILLSGPWPPYNFVDSGRSGVCRD